MTFIQNVMGSSGLGRDGIKAVFVEDWPARALAEDKLVGEEEPGTFPYLAEESVAPGEDSDVIDTTCRGGPGSLTGGPHRPARREESLAGGWGISQGHQEPENRASFFSLPFPPGLLRVEA